MIKKKIKAIGLIVEDNSDFEAFKVIISRIAEKNNLTFKKAIGNGCGKLKRKATSYVNNLHQKGCDMVILVHDLDRNDYVSLNKTLNSLIKDGIPKYKLVCIPIEEIEGWFLSDPEALQEAFVLDKLPKIKGLPETISSPKEKIGELILQYSDNKKIYLNTTHNTLLAKKISIDKMKNKCKSFNELYDFIKSYDY